MSSRTIESREELDDLIFALAKTYRRLARKHAVKLEMTIIGGASILLNYNFRSSTVDVDAMILNAAVLKDAIKLVAQHYHLEQDWLNTDFEKTSSFSIKLIEHSKFYKSYLGLIEVRTIKDEHLIAMKLKASRDYKYDLSDVVGILYECTQKKMTIDRSRIQQAVMDLYGSLDQISQEAWSYLELVLEHQTLDFLYEAIRASELSFYEVKLAASQIKATKKEDNTQHLLESLKTDDDKLDPDHK